MNAARILHAYHHQKLNNRIAECMPRYIEVFKNLPEEEQARLEEIMNALQTHCKNMGTISALELIGKLGEFIAKNGERP